MFGSIIYVAIVSVVSMGVMLAISKLIGNRQISELSIFDHINSITIGSIAAELASSDNLQDTIRFLVATVIYGTATFLFAYITNKIPRLRPLFEGEPIILMSGGKIDRAAFAKARLDVNEFLSQCRLLGYFDPSQIDTAVIEAGGKMSVIPKSYCKPLTVGDAGLVVNQEHPSVVLISDGRIIEKNLRFIGKDTEWLAGELALAGENTQEVFLAIYTEEGFKIIPNIPQNPEDKSRT